MSICYLRLSVFLSFPLSLSRPLALSLPPSLTCTVLCFGVCVARAARRPRLRCGRDAVGCMGGGATHSDSGWRPASRLVP
eukprot:658523-Pleurochrysis_carterae.AAC.1